MSTAVLDVLPSVAVIVAVVDALTGFAFTVNVAEVRPDWILTDAGTVAEDALLESEITKPPVGAMDVSVTVPVLDLPPLTEVGFSVNDSSVGGSIVSVAV